MRGHRDVQGLPKARHESLLREVATGELSPLTELVQRLREGCPLCAARMQTHLELQLLLDDEGQRRRDEILEEALKTDAFPGDEDVSRVIFGLAARSAGASTVASSRSFTKLAWILGLAAASLLALFLWPEGEATKPTSRGEIRMGAPEEEKDFGPEGSVEEWPEEFWWSDELPPGGWFNLVIRDPISGEELVREEDLEVSKWKPDPKPRSQLTDSLHLQVEVVDPTGARRNGSSWSVSRSSDSSRER